MSQCQTEVGVTRASFVELIQVQKSIFSAISTCLSFFLAFKSKIYRKVRYEMFPIAYLNNRPSSWGFCLSCNCEVIRMKQNSLRFHWLSIKFETLSNVNDDNFLLIRQTKLTPCSEIETNFSLSNPRTPGLNNSALRPRVVRLKASTYLTGGFAAYILINDRIQI